MYIIFSLLIIVVSYNLFKKCNVSMNLLEINMLSFVFYVYFILMTYISQILILENLTLDPMLPKVYSEHYESCFYVWLSTSYAMIMVPLTIFLLNRLLFKRKLQNMKIQKCSIVVTQHNNDLIYFILSVVSIVSIILTIYKFNYIGLLDMFSGRYSHFARTNYTYNVSINRYVTDVFAQMLSQIMAYIWYIKLKLYNKKRNYVMFTVMFFFSILSLSMSMSKAPIIIFIFTFIFLKIKVDGRLKIKNILIITIVLLILLINIYISIYNVDIISALNKIVERVILYQNTGNYLCFIYFPDVIPHLGMTSLSQRISSLLGIPYSLRAARLVSEYAFGVSADGVIGSIVSLFIGDAWASFGIYGVIFSPILVGLVLGTIYYTTYYSNKIEMWALYAYFTVNNYVVMDFNSFIYPWSPFVRPFIFAMAIIVLGIRVKKQIKKV